MIPVARNEHGERRADAGKAVDHQSDQRPIAQADRRRQVDRIEQRPGFRRVEHSRLALRALCEGQRTDAAGFTAMIWPVTSQSNR